MAMTSERWQRMRNLFVAAADLSPERRLAFLKGACGDDAELRRELEQLLAEADGEDTLIQDVISRQAADLAADDGGCDAEGRRGVGSSDEL